MLWNYYVLMRTDSSKNIVNVKVSELGIELRQKELESLTMPQIKKLINQRIEERIFDLQRQNVEIPSPKSVFELLNTAEAEFYMLTKVEVTLKKGFFARWLPRFGAVSCVVTATSGSVISTISLMLAMKKVENQALAFILSVSQAILFNSFNAVVYFYSHSGDVLEGIGSSWDAFFTGRKKMVEEPLAPQSIGTTSALLLAKLFLTAATVGNTISLAASSSVQFDALGKQAHDAGLISDFLFELSKVILIASSSLSGLSFVTGFLTRLYKDLEKYMLTKGVDTEFTSGEASEGYYVALDIPSEPALNPRLALSPSYSTSVKSRKKDLDEPRTANDKQNSDVDLTVMSRSRHAH